MKSNISLLILLGIFLTFNSCNDFFEIDISKKEVKVISPSDSLTSVVLTQTFFWEEVEGALLYRVQVVSPSFNSVSQFIIDSTISITKFQYTLQPGKYQWRVKAINGSSETGFSQHTLTLDTTSDITSQIILIQNPANLSFSNKMSNNFKWTHLYNVLTYNVQISRSNFSNPLNIIVDTIVEDNSAILSVLQEGEYQFRVKGKNSLGETKFATPVLFSIDTTSPTSPSLLIPSNNGVCGNPIGFYWDNGADTGSPVTDSIFIYSDSLATMIRRVGHTNSSFHSDSLSAGTYFWRVKSWDKAGNESLFSTTRKFRIN